jgi:hypothetical protein
METIGRFYFDDFGELLKVPAKIFGNSFYLFSLKFLK